MINKSFNFYLLRSCCVMIMLISGTPFKAQDTEATIAQLNVHFDQLRAGETEVAAFFFRTAPFPPAEYRAMRKKDSLAAMAGAFCYISLYSKRAKNLFEIYNLYQPVDSTQSFHLVDTVSGEVIYDLNQKNCGRAEEVGKTTAINLRKWEDLLRSYEMWDELVQTHGLEYVRAGQISPLYHVPFAWKPHQHEP